MRIRQILEENNGYVKSNKTLLQYKIGNSSSLQGFVHCRFIWNMYIQIRQTFCSGLLTVLSTSCMG